MWLVWQKLGRRHPDHGGGQHPTTTMVPSPQHNNIQQSSNMLKIRSMQLKLERIGLLFYVLAFQQRRSKLSMHCSTNTKLSSPPPPTLAYNNHPCLSNRWCHPLKMGGACSNGWPHHHCWKCICQVCCCEGESNSGCWKWQWQYNWHPPWWSLLCNTFVRMLRMCLQKLHSTRDKIWNEKWWLVDGVIDYFKAIPMNWLVILHKSLRRWKWQGGFSREIKNGLTVPMSFEGWW